MSEPKIRYYKGKYRVEVLMKSKGNYLVKALETVDVPYKGTSCNGIFHIHNGCEFVTVPRLLWKNKKQ